MDKIKAEAQGGERGIKEPMSLKEEIVERGLNPEYIKNLAEAIVKEASYPNMDLAYISEKNGAMKRYIDDIVEMQRMKDGVRVAIEKRAEEIEKRFEGDEEGLRAFLRRPMVGDIDSRFNGIRCKATSRGGMCSAKKREFEYATENPNNKGTWICKDCGRLYSEEELLELLAEMDEEKVCEVCGNPATIGLNQPDGLLLYLCDKCYAERGIEEEDVWGVCQ